MSYILDALKKSEQQRSSMSLPITTPTSAPQPASATSRFRLPLILLAIALAAGWFFVRFQQPVQHSPPPLKTAQTASIRHETHPSTTQPRNRDHAIPSSRTAPAPATHEPQSSTSIAPRPDAHQAPKIRSKADSIPVFKPITPVSPVSRASNPLPELADETAQASPAETNIVSWRELPLSVQQSLPPINIEGHIYDENPAVRMVIINGKIRREKQSLGNMLKLEEITPNGVILSYQRHVFHMGVFEK